MFRELRINVPKDMYDYLLKESLRIGVPMAYVVRIHVRDAMNKNKKGEK